MDASLTSRFRQPSSPVSLCLLVGFIAIFWLSWNPAAATAQSWSADDGYVAFVSRAPLLEFKGTSRHLNGRINPDNGEVDFYVDLATLDTGNRRRDRDMRQVYLETEKYPFAEFFGILTSDFDPAVPGEQEVEVQGEFTMREISRPLSLSGTMERTPDGIRVRASWEILLGDYNIDRPRVVFYELSDVQRVSIDVTLRQQD